jgi:hypothetical protein
MLKEARSVKESKFDQMEARIAEEVVKGLNLKSVNK